jgi:hypothetical protein
LNELKKSARKSTEKWANTDQLIFPGYYEKILQNSIYEKERDLRNKAGAKGRAPAGVKDSPGVTVKRSSVKKFSKDLQSTLATVQAANLKARETSNGRNPRAGHCKESERSINKTSVPNSESNIKFSGLNTNTSTNNSYHNHQKMTKQGRGSKTPRICANRFNKI